MVRSLPKLLAALMILAALPTMAQRYTTEMFSDVTVTSNVKYGENYSVLTGTPVLEDLLVDIYEPTGDTETDRYLIIMMHAGSYLPKGINTLPFGNKEDSTIVEMCTQFAKRGWVAASISYRLGWNPAAATEEDRASGIINAVYRSMQDAKSAVRFFRMDADGANTYGIDPTRIAVGGSNSGGYTALATDMLDKTPETELLKFLDGNGDSFIDPAVTGGFDGEGGAMGVNNVNHPGYPSNVQLVLNLGGATGDTSWQEMGDAPVVNFHGIDDALTPYNTDVVIVASTNQAIVEVSGSSDIAKRAQNLGNSDVFINAGFNDVYTQASLTQAPYEGLFLFAGAANGFEPWAWYDPSDPNIAPGSGFGSAANPLASKPKALAYIDTIMNYFNPRAVEAMANPIALEPWVSVQEQEQPKYNVKIGPNPASDEIRVLSTYATPISSIIMTDLAGRTVRADANLNTNTYTVDRGNLPAGIYLLNIRFGEETLTEKVILR